MSAIALTREERATQASIRSLRKLGSGARLEGWPKVSDPASLVLRDGAKAAPQHEAPHKYPDFACDSTASGFDARACDVYVMGS
jgi:hypothetical protein